MLILLFWSSASFALGLMLSELLKRWKDNKSFPQARGEDLDILGYHFGLSRLHRESDKKYRKRVEQLLRRWR